MGRRPPFPPSALPRSNLAGELFFEAFPSLHLSPARLPFLLLQISSCLSPPPRRPSTFVALLQLLTRPNALASAPTAMHLRRSTMLPLALFLAPLLGLYQVRAEGNVTCADSSVCESPKRFRPSELPSVNPDLSIYSPCLLRPLSLVVQQVGPNASHLT